MRHLLLLLTIASFSTNINVIVAQQLFTTPLNSNPAVQQKAFQLQQTKIRKGGGIIDTIPLPFLDDFSYADNDVYPDCNLWTDKSTYINQTLAIAPPTIGVATFDGANAQGAPYSESGQGSADTLTCMPLALSGKTSADNVQLSFFYQPRGLGDKPGSSDSLIIEFKDQNDNWNNVWSYSDTTSSIDVPVFNFVNIPITSSAYLYDGFQFRIRNLATLTGMRDLWHVDYVRVTEGQTPSTTLNDVAFNEQAVSIFKTYTALPWKHFEGFEADELATQSQLSIFNHFNTAQFVSNPAAFTIYDENANIVFSTNILNFGADPINGNMAVGINAIDSVFASVDYTNLVSSFAPYNGSDSLSLDVEVFISPNNQQTTIPAILSNDTIYNTIHFKDYFAYDDGSAETAVAAGRIGDQFAIEYHTNAADTLKAVQMHLPRFAGNTTNQRINLKIWLDVIDETPEVQINFVKPIYVDSIEGWTTYSLDTNALFLPAGSRFYVGWQQATTPQTIAQSFLIGYDRNNAAGFGKIYQNVGAAWERLDTLPIQPEPGAIMIRPIVGEGMYVSTNVDNVTQATNEVIVDIFPNPTRNYLNIHLNNTPPNNASYYYQIFNTLGVLMQTGALDHPQNQVILNDLANGLHFVKIMDSNNQVISVKKMMVIR